MKAMYFHKAFYSQINIQDIYEGAVEKFYLNIQHSFPDPNLYLIDLLSHINVLMALDMRARPYLLFQ